jgi:hypothetical protein
MSISEEIGKKWQALTSQNLALPETAWKTMDKMRKAKATLEIGLKDPMSEGKPPKPVKQGKPGQAGPARPQQAQQPVRMQAGGIVTQPTNALIGEAGPEAVIPLGAGAQGEQSKISPLITLLQLLGLRSKAQPTPQVPMTPQLGQELKEAQPPGMTSVPSLSDLLEVLKAREI